jgi:hypothetical protein
MFLIRVFVVVQIAPMRFLIVTLAILAVCSTGAVAQIPWVETGYSGAGLIKGEIRQIEVEPSGRIYGVVEYGPTIVSTSDEGATWKLHKGPEGKITGLEKFGGKFYISTLDSGLYISSNFVTWDHVELPDNARQIERIDADKGILLIKIKGDSRYIYSVTQGSPFLRIPDSLAIEPENAIAPRGQNEILYLSKAGFWQSIAGTNEWRRISNGIKALDMTVIKDSIYVGSTDVGGGPILLASKIGPLKFDSILIEFNGMQFKQMYTMNDTVLVAYRENLGIGLQEIHTSLNRRELSPPGDRAGYTINDMSLANGRYYVASVSSISKSEDYAEHWTKLSTRLEPKIVRHLITVPGNGLVASTSHGEILTCFDGGDTWKLQSKLTVTATLLAYSPQGTLFVGYQGGLFASTDLGKTFVGSNEGFALRTPQSFAVGKDNKLFLGTDSGLFFSTNDGATWFMPQSVNMTIVSPDRFLPEVFSIAIDPRTNGMYVGTNRGVLYSLDEGEKYESGWLSKTPIYSLAVNRKGEVFAGSHAISAADPNKRNFYRGWDVLSTNPAWVATDTSIERFDLDKMMLNSRDQIISGVLFSSSSGTDWEIGTIEGEGSPHSVLAQAIDNNDIAYLSYGEKVYKSAAPKLTRDRLPLTATVSVYPNPCRDVVRFGNDVEGEVRIINALGNTVLAMRIGPGEAIDVSDIPSGNYLCQIAFRTGVSRVPFVVAR